MQMTVGEIIAAPILYGIAIASGKVAFHNTPEYRKLRRDKVARALDIVLTADIAAIGLPLILNGNPEGYAMLLGIPSARILGSKIGDKLIDYFENPNSFNENLHSFVSSLASRFSRIYRF